MKKFSNFKVNAISKSEMTNLNGGTIDLAAICAAYEIIGSTTTDDNVRWRAVQLATAFGCPGTPQD